MLSAQMLTGIPEVPSHLSPRKCFLSVSSRKCFLSVSYRKCFLSVSPMFPECFLHEVTQVDLGIEVKIQNIERTERAKKLLMQSGKLSTGHLTPGG